MFIEFITAFMIFVPIFIVESKLVSTSTGYVNGKLQESFASSYYSYQGIPYAEPPVGTLRFKPPIPITPWEDTLDATKEGAVCPQTEGNYKRDQMSEDCLFLNVYTPVNATTALPVLVYVHGGEFKSLSGNSDVAYNPSLILARDLIVVTMNYRLGALGFLSLDTEEATGNNGIKDVILALQWVKENIKAFGGDPDRTTLGGNSAGAVLVHCLILTTRTTGLFQRTIQLSGSALGYRFLALHPKENALTLSRELGIETTNAQDIVMELREIDAFDIVKAQESIGKNNTRNGYRPFSPFVPCVEINSSHAVITKHPYNIIREGIPQNVPVLAGFNKNEGIKMLPVVKKDPSLLTYLNENFELLIPSNIEYPYSSEESLQLAKSIRRLYLKDSDISLDENSIGDYLNLVGDTQMKFPIDYWIKLHKSNQDSNTVYYYEFDFDGELNWFKIVNNITDYPGTSHGDEIGYLFETKATKDILKSLNPRSKRMLDVMLTVICNYVKYGNPNEGGGIQNGVFPVIWPESGLQRSHMELSDTPYGIYTAPDTFYLSFWNRKYRQYYQYLDNGGRTEPKIVP